VGARTGRGRRDRRRPELVAARFDLRWGARPGNCREQLGAPHRLDDIVVDSGGAQGRDLDGQVVGREHHHEPRPPRTATHQAFRDFKCAPRRHRAVEQQDLEARLASAVVP